MDETLNPVDAGLAEVVDSQPTEPAGVSESAAPAEQPVSEAPKETKTEVKQSPEENAQFKALRLAERQKAEQTARDSVYAKLASDSGVVGLDGRPITTEADYVSYATAAAKMREYMAKGETEESARLKVEADQLKQEIARRDTEAQRANYERMEQNDFFKYFEAVNGHKWTEADGIPQPVMDAKAMGIPLKYAYAEYKAKELIEKSKNVEAGKKTAEANATNAATSTGSVTGTASNSILTDESIEKMSPKEMEKNWAAIKKHWNMK